MSAVLRGRRALAAAVALCLVLAGCASADKTTTGAAGAGNSGAGSGMSSGMSMSSSGSGSSLGSGASSTGSGGSMAGMSMGANGSGTGTVVNAQGVATPVPIKTIATGYWKDMKIQAQETTPVPFEVYNGGSFREIKPTKHTSFHLMVMLSDRQTGVAIPYATVWATITKGTKTVFNEQQWAMLSRWMGPHYGNDVTLPGPGTYKLSLLISAPVSAMHMEYAHMWVGRHKLTATFTWPQSK